MCASSQMLCKGTVLLSPFSPQYWEWSTSKYLIIVRYKIWHASIIIMIFFLMIKKLHTSEWIGWWDRCASGSLKKWIHACSHHAIFFSTNIHALPSNVVLLKAFRDSISETNTRLRSSLWCLWPLIKLSNIIWIRLLCFLFLRIVLDCFDKHFAFFRFFIKFF